jgi:predicted O-methyltransferase YrrM
MWFARALPARHAAGSIILYPQTDRTLSETSKDLRFSFKYQPTYANQSDFIDEAHKALADAPTLDGMIDIGIPGWLLPADALKLYELAYFATGDVYEVGTYRGLATTIMALAAKRSGRRFALVSIDLDAELSAFAKMEMAARGAPGFESCHFFAADGIHSAETMARTNRRFSLVFVDHSHQRQHVAAICRHLADIVEPGGFVMFHDYNDPRNAAGDAPDYGVYQGVKDALDRRSFTFAGIFGCSGLFRRNPISNNYIQRILNFTIR